MFWRFVFKPGRSVDASLTYDGLPAWVGENHYIDLSVGSYVLSDDNKTFIITVQADDTVIVSLPAKQNYLDKGARITHADLSASSNTLDDLGIHSVTLSPGRARSLEITFWRGSYYADPVNSRYSIYWVH